MTNGAIVCTLVAALAVFAAVCHLCLCGAAIHAGGLEPLKAPAHFLMTCFMMRAFGVMLTIARDTERDAGP